MVIAVCAPIEEDRRTLHQLLLCRLNYLCADAEIQLFDNALSLSEALASGAFSMLYLDADMPDNGAVKLAKNLRSADENCKIILFSSSAERATETYFLRPSGYLIKPIDADRFAKVFDWCEDVWRDSMRYIEVKSNRITTKIRLADIRCVEVCGRTCIIHRISDDILENCSLNKMETLLGGAPFLRCHKSFVVNLNHILTQTETGFVTDNGQFIPVSPDRAEEIFNIFKANLATQI